jgi:hypothetical protein
VSAFVVYSILPLINFVIYGMPRLLIITRTIVLPLLYLVYGGHSLWICRFC